MADLLATRVRRGALIPVAIEGVEQPHWIAPGPVPDVPDAAHVLSPFDPLIIQRARLSTFFGYDHLFEAYVPAAKRKLGYFALPILIDDRITAAIDIGPVLTAAPADMPMALFGQLKVVAAKIADVSPNNVSLPVGSTAAVPAESRFYWRSIRPHPRPLPIRELEFTVVYVDVWQSCDYISCL